MCTVHYPCVWIWISSANKVYCQANKLRPSAADWKAFITSVLFQSSMFLFTLISRRCLHFYSFPHCLFNSCCPSPKAIANLGAGSPSHFVLPDLTLRQCQGLCCYLWLLQQRGGLRTPMAFHQVLSLLCHLVSSEGILILSGLPWFPVLCRYGLRSHAAEWIQVGFCMTCVVWLCLPDPNANE